MLLELNLTIARELLKCGAYAPAREALRCALKDAVGLPKTRSRILTALKHTKAAMEQTP
jgi:hypothetical protein